MGIHISGDVDQEVCLLKFLNLSGGPQCVLPTLYCIESRPISSWRVEL